MSLPEHGQMSGEALAFGTIEVEGRPRWGGVTAQGVSVIDDLFPEWPTLRHAITAPDGVARMTDEVLARGETSGNAGLTWLPPMPDAPRILCVGVNFPDRNAEYRDGSEQPKHMSLFPRFISGFVGHGRPLIRPPESPQLDYEGEVALVIGRGGRRIAREDAYGHIAALTLCNEGTIRDWVRHAKFNVTQGKNWDRSGAMGPWLVPFTDPAQIDDCHLTTRVNGELRQDDHLRNMMFPVSEQIAYISTFMTLQPGDMIVTGTPSGAGARFDPPRFLVPGDVVEISATGLGTLRNTVEDEA
jgi:2-keto-4-pentenoate hydratase/2-oxohepta-3-ene-1,7-dioic acid hydratase in catechol pathway